MDRPVEKKHPLIRYKSRWVGGGVLIVLIGYALFATIGPSRLSYNKADLIVAEVTQGKFLEYLEVDGLAQPRLTVKLNAPESGTVDRLVAEEGRFLQKGDTILILYNPELQRTIEDEKDELEKHRIEYQEKTIAMQRKTSELKRATLKTTYELNRLNKQYVLDQEEFQIGIKSKAQLEVASDEYSFNKKNTELLLQELEHDSLMNIIQLGLMKSDLEREEKKFLRNQERLNELIVRAPITGQLSFLNVTSGESIVRGNNVGEMKMVDDLKLSTKVGEYYIERITPGLPAFIQYQDKRYPLKVTKVNPEIKERNFEIDLVFTEDVPDNIRIGKSVRIQIELGQPEDALVVERGNFYLNTGGRWVYKLNKSGNRAIRTDVRIGRQNPKQYEILEGLSSGDKIVISGYDNFGNSQELILK